MSNVKERIETFEKIIEYELGKFKRLDYDYRNIKYIDDTKYLKELSKILLQLEIFTRSERLFDVKPKKKG